MIDIRSPRHRADEFERLRECQMVFRTAFENLVRKSVAAGWREQEVALQLADIAEDYVLYLATKAGDRPSAANEN